jgi:hypothetical protein
MAEQPSSSSDGAKGEFVMDAHLGGDSGSAGLPALGPPPTPAVRELNKLANVVISSATISLIRALMMRPAGVDPVGPDAAVGAAKLPAWFQDQYTTRQAATTFLRQVRSSPFSLCRAKVMHACMQDLMHRSMCSPPPTSL